MVAPTTTRLRLRVAPGSARAGVVAVPRNTIVELAGIEPQQVEQLAAAGREESE